jgi:ferredoxin
VQSSAKSDQIPLRVRIAPARCQGHNRCRAIAPAIFDVDDYGQATVLNDGVVPPELEARVRLAAANCPELAISVEQDG